MKFNFNSEPTPKSQKPLNQPEGDFEEDFSEWTQ